MKKSCKLLGLILVLCMLLAMFAGCTTGGGNTSPPTNHTEATAPSGSDPTDGTEPADGGEVTDPTDPTQGEVPTDPTDPTGNTDVSGTDATEESGEQETTQPTNPGATEAPTEQPTEGSEPTDPTEAPTEAPTEKSTEAPTEAPTDPPHVHEYEKKVVKPSCEKKGYTKYTCSCGDSYKDNYKDPTGHDYDQWFVSQTCTEQGYCLHTCQNCGATYKDQYSPPEGHDYMIVETKEPTYNGQGYILRECTFCGDSYYTYYSMTNEEREAIHRNIEAAVVKYINQFRVEQGDTEMEYLPGMSQVAQMRAEQLKTKWGHDPKLLKEAHAYYQYGKYMDATEFGDDASLSYWSSNSREAIALNGLISASATADEVGYALASQFRNSPNHWAYLGSSDYEFIGVGVSSSDGWICCILQPDANYG